MIRILPPEEAKKIAAGEVIDRPLALVRELTDNALDSGAENIELSIEGGGISRLELTDNGCGMSKEDLALCIKPHATSKIQSLNDLSRSTTLGFRGEALAAASAVARLEIVSSTDGREAWLLESNPSVSGSSGETQKITQSRRQCGTSVRVFGLFDTIPARKRFLKREASEALLCRQMFIEKALAFPGISFRFVQDQQLKLQFIPQTDNPQTDSPQSVSSAALSLQIRFGEAILDVNERRFLHTVETAGSGYTITIVFGGPELYRRDRKQQYIFANKRRIQDYGLMQALEYGLAGFFPNDSHPLGAVFIEIDPALADFNIHPAKREVRFANGGAIHNSITAALRNYVGKNTNNFESQSYQIQNYSSQNYLPSLAMEALLKKSEEFAPLPSRSASETVYTSEQESSYDLQDWENGKAETQQGIKLIGRAFELFIIVERGDKLYLIDQHAAHENFLYRRFLSAPITAQELLVPIPFTTDTEDQDTFLKEKKVELAQLGIKLEHEGGGSWHIQALPANWKTSDSETIKEILALQKAGQNFAERWAFTFACHSAIKDSEYLDNAAAQALAESVLTQRSEKGSIPRCPHGRPLWTELSKAELLKAVRR